MMDVLAVINESNGCAEESEYQRLAKIMLVEGAREFARWCLRQSDDKVATGIDAALVEFASDIGVEGAWPSAVVNLPAGWVAVPELLTPEMLTAFQAGFMQELRRRNGRKESAEQAGLRAALKARPSLPVGWK
jgi:hypothetical protein